MEILVELEKRESEKRETIKFIDSIDQLQRDYDNNPNVIYMRKKLQELDQKNENI